MAVLGISWARQTRFSMSRKSGTVHSGRQPWVVLTVAMAVPAEIESLELRQRGSEVALGADMSRISAPLKGQGRTDLWLLKGQKPAL